MKVLKQIVFEYEDGSKCRISDSRAAAVFQSRCNSSGILSGLEGTLEEISGDPIIDRGDSKEGE